MFHHQDRLQKKNHLGRVQSPSWPNSTSYFTFVKRSLCRNCVIIPFSAGRYEQDVNHFRKQDFFLLQINCDYLKECVNLNLNLNKADWHIARTLGFLCMKWFQLCYNHNEGVQRQFAPLDFKKVYSCSGYFTAQEPLPVPGYAYCVLLAPPTTSPPHHAKTMIECWNWNQWK